MQKPKLKIIFEVKSRDLLAIKLAKGGKIMDKSSLTISRDFDTLLIRALDKLFSSNRIDRLSLKSIEIRGEMEPNRLSSIVLGSLTTALSV